MLRNKINELKAWFARWQRARKIQLRGGRYVLVKHCSPFAVDSSMGYLKAEDGMTYTLIRVGELPAKGELVCICRAYPVLQREERDENAFWKVL